MRRIPLATRQLGGSRSLAVGGVMGIAAALVLIIVLDAFLQGMEYRLTGFVRATGADVVVAQRGVQTMHMTESAIPLARANQVRAVPGVRDAIPALYVPATVQSQSGSGLVYLIGYEPEGPQLVDLDRGTAPRRGQIVLDTNLARQLSVDTGSVVSIMNQDLRVSGLVSGTFSIASSTALMDIEDLSAALATPDTASYVFVRAEPGTSQASLARSIEQGVSAVSATPTTKFVELERRVVSDMATGVVRAITLTALVIGLVIAALISHTLVARQSRDIAVLRAIGLPDRHAISLALRQAALLLAGAIVLSLAVVLVLDVALPRVADSLTIRVMPGRVVQAQMLVAAAVIAGSLLPAWRTLSVDPAQVFRT